MNLYQFLSGHHIPFQENVSLSRKTWVKTGGVCRYWVTPVSVAQLVELCKFLHSEHLAYDIVGQTSNIFFHSTYHPQVVISTIRINGYTIKDDVLISDCGVSVVKLAKDCMAAGYSGFYGLVELPGTVASAVVNNSSCFDCSISSLLISADVLMPDGEIRTIFKDQIDFGHHTSSFKRHEIQGVLFSVRLRLQKSDNPEGEYRKSASAVDYRKEKQEGPYRNLGSIYAHREYRHTLRSRIASMGARLLVKLKFSDDLKRTKKKLLLSLYGFGDLNDYISDKTFNTFIWKDEKAEGQFERYKLFISKVYRNLELEIEERA